MRQRRLASAALCGLLALAALAGAAPPARGAAAGPTLLADANTLAVTLGSYNPQELLALGDGLVFRGWSQRHGVELYRRAADGSVTLVRDLRPGVEPDEQAYGSAGARLFTSPLPGSLTALGGRFAFVADDGSYGPELWVSDGTPAGTRMVADLLPGTTGSAPGELTAHAGALFFVADDGLGGRRLFRSDGTAAGTTALDPASPGAVGCQLRGLGDALYYLRRPGPSAGWELRRVDGATGVATTVAPLSGEASCWPGTAAVGGGKLFFVADGALWASDGTAAGTARLLGFRGSGAPQEMVAFAERVYFSASGFDDAGEELWRSDGTPAGTLRVVDARPGPESSAPRDLTVAGNRIYFSADDGVHGREPWVSSGFLTGNRMLADLHALGSSDPSGFMAVGGTIFFSAAATFEGRELWRSQGSAATTARVADLVPGSDGSDPQTLAALGGALYFAASDGVSGRELWRTDGSAAGTLRMTDLENRVATDSSFPVELTAVGRRLFYLAGSDRWGDDRQLWRSDGTAGGTSAVPLPDSSIHRLVLLGDSVLLAGQDLWRHSGQPGTVERIAALGLSFEPRSFARQGTRLLFFATNLDEFVDHLSELWATDGTDGGTVRLVQLEFNDAPYNLTPVGGRLLFFQGFGYSPAYAELWETDGTPAGTRPVKMIRSPMLDPVGSDFPFVLAVHAGRLFFVIDDGVHGPELWASDGTADGTVLLADIMPGPEGSGPKYLTPCGPRLCFVAGDPAHGVELWASDGTAAGTRLVADLMPGRGSAFPSGAYDPGWFAAAGPLAYFPANDGVHGAELWATDGTAAGTRLVADLVPGPAGSLPRPLAAVAGRLALHAYDAEHGAELWVSDGTAAGTRRVTDLAPGPEDSRPSQLVAAGDRIFFSADDGRHGREVWALPLSALDPPQELQRARVALPLVAR